MLLRQLSFRWILLQTTIGIFLCISKGAQGQDLGRFAHKIVPRHRGAGTMYNGFENIKYAMFFGDSYSNNRYDINAAPHPSDTHPLGVPWPGLGSPNGPNWVAYLTTHLNASKLLSFDIAFGGATVDRTIISPFVGYIWDFVDQVSRWRNRLGVQSRPWGPYPWKSDETMFFIWFGINDVMRTHTVAGVDHTVLYDRVLDSYFRQIETLYNASARNFVFLNIPPIHLAPANTLPAEKSRISTLLTTFNSKLLSRINSLAASSYELSVWYINTYQIFESVLRNPGQFGFRNSTQFCGYYKPYTGNEDWERKWDARCGVSVREYFLLDNLHPTSYVHCLVANAVRWAL